MSYIRCLSNPEGMYIWGDGKNINITLSTEPDFCGKIRLIPQKIFDGLIKKYNKYHDDIKYKGASIIEVFIANGKKISKKEEELFGKDGDFKIRLSYKDWHIDMWKVTWEYITRRK